MKVKNPVSQNIRIFEVNLQKQITQKNLKNHVFSLCIPINLNKTAGFFLTRLKNN